MVRNKTEKLAMKMRVVGYGKRVSVVRIRGVDRGMEIQKKNIKLCAMLNV